MQTIANHRVAVIYAARPGTAVLSAIFLLQASLSQWAMKFAAESMKHIFQYKKHQRQSTQTEITSSLCAHGNFALDGMKASFYY